ncbi:hypothetical protein HYH03_003865 [Edaphochlamys debaryana]|uniref:Uncharacterized protein n=1 Tax=Edaphochlamys debaryana TaxID=47281 RepID=A0A835Y8A3_9CHLO|nr:hypothetical protein HYH03_003865 [Edaphochlamys debaryana]|eukprot:KAG2498107.1 hypothetical protein HYH03_003865 [Edaphochlamys debaryana]
MAVVSFLAIGDAVGKSKPASCNSVVDKFLQEDPAWIAISIALLVGGIIAAGVVARMASDHFSWGLALLSLYVFLYWLARTDGLPAEELKCFPETTLQALSLHWALIFKVVGGAVGVASGLAFAAQYTSTMLFQVGNHIVPEGLFGALAEWLAWEFPLSLFFFCNVGMHLVGYSLLGAVAGGGVVFACVFTKLAFEAILIGVFLTKAADDKDDYTLPQRLWATLWRAAVSSLANVPWRERCGIAAPDFDAPAPTGSRNTRAWLVFTTSLSVSVSLAVAEAATVIGGSLRYTSADGWWWWPGDDKGVAWFLVSFICGTGLFLLLAVGLAELRYRRS